MQLSTGNLCQFTTSVSDRELIFYYKQTNKNIKTQKKSNRKRHKKNIIMNILTNNCFKNTNFPEMSEEIIEKNAKQIKKKCLILHYASPVIKISNKV